MRLLRTCLLALALLLSALGAPAGAAPDPAGPVQVQVGVYLMSVGKLDISANSYYLDFYLIFHCDRPCNPGNFEIMNGRSYTVDKQDDEPTYKVFRVKGELTNNMNLRPFPFDRHELLIALEDKMQTSASLVYASDGPRTGLHEDMVVAGWHISPGSLRTAVRSDSYPVFGQSYSRYQFTVTLDRPWLSAFLKGLLPALLIVMSGMLSLLMSADKIMQRLTVCTSALVASVLFHINLTSSIPPVGYLTFADRVMLLNYLTLSVALAGSIAVMNQLDARLDARAAATHGRVKWLVPAGWVALQTINLLAGVR